MSKRSKRAQPAPARAGSDRTGNDRAGKSAPRGSGFDPRTLIPPGMPLLSHWSPLRSYLFLSAATILIMVPFSGKAFHLDDTLFLFAARQIVKHPFDPYGFEVVWNTTAERMSDITKNPPLACYYSALVGSVAGWTERALHVAFLLPALGVVLGTYRLAQRCTHFPLLAALAALLTPGVVVSATSVMCDTMMTALWIWAVILWVEGLEPLKPIHLAASGVLIAASGLTKYFGLALIPLLLVYSVIRLRRAGWWMAYLAIPILAAVGYEIWTGALYGQGLISNAAEFAGSQRAFQQGSTMSHALASLSFAGGCALSVLTLAPLLWSWKQILLGAVVSGFAAAAVIFSWVDMGARVGGPMAAQAVMNHWLFTLIQLSLCIGAGICVLALAAIEVWTEKQNPESWLLAFWVMGTWIFTGFLNWTVNARSVLPLIPAVGILIFRRLDRQPVIFTRNVLVLILVCGLAVSGLVAFSVASSDVAWANSAREAANLAYQKTRTEHRHVFFMGHWGFQYYMQTLGFTPADEINSKFELGDLVIIPLNNTEYVPLPQDLDLVEQEHIELPLDSLSTTMSATLGAGFYSSYWGPLPFAFGQVQSEVYRFGRIVPARRQPARGN